MSSNVEMVVEEPLMGIQVSGLVHQGSQPIQMQRAVYSNSQLRSSTTNEEGIYTVEGLPSGEVLAWMSAEGYANTYSPNDDRPTTFLPITEEGTLYDLLKILMHLWKITPYSMHKRKKAFKEHRFFCTMTIEPLVEESL